MEKYKNKKSIVIYFSRADENYAVGYIENGNTEVLAEYIRDFINCDIFKVEASVPYAKDYDTCIKEAEERQTNHNAPIIESIPDLSSYEVIYIGSPVYWNVMPEELVTALSGINFSGKIIRPFVTHEGSGLGGIPDELRRVCLGAEVVSPIAIKGTDVYNAKSKIEEWISK